MVNKYLLPLLVITLMLTNVFGQKNNRLLWSDPYGGFHTCNLDGTDPHILFNLPTNPLFNVDIAVNSETKNIYWFDYVTSHLQVIGSETNGIQNIVNIDIIDQVTAMALNETTGRIYWFEASGEPWSPAEEPNLGRLLSVGEAGGDVEVVTPVLNYSIKSLAIDSDNDWIYMIDEIGDHVFRSKGDGSSFEILYNSLSALGYLYIDDITLDIANGFMYLSSGPNGKIYKAALDGSSIIEIVTGLSLPGSIVYDQLSDKIYWTNRSNGNLFSANTDGTNVSSLPVYAWGNLALLPAVHVEFEQTSATVNEGGIIEIPIKITGDLSDFNRPFYMDIEIETDDAELRNAIVAYDIVYIDPVILEYDPDHNFTLNIQVDDNDILNEERLFRVNIIGVNGDVFYNLGYQGIDIGSNESVEVTVLDSFSQTMNRLVWTESSVHDIVTSNLDGTESYKLISTGLLGPSGIAVHSETGQLYWTDRWTNKIQRSDADGTNVEDLVTTDLYDAFGIAIDEINDKFYWADTALSVIKRANLDGSDVETLVTGTGTSKALAIDAKEGKIYWSNYTNGLVQCSNLDGSEVTTLYSNNNSGYNELGGISLDCDKEVMYFVSRESGSIYRAAMDGSSVMSIITNLGNPIGITYDKFTDKIYWVDGDWVDGYIIDATEGVIRSANTDGSDIKILKNANTPKGITLAPSLFTFLEFNDDSLAVTEGQMIQIPINIIGSPTETITCRVDFQASDSNLATVIDFNEYIVVYPNTDNKISIQIPEDALQTGNRSFILKITEILSSHDIYSRVGITENNSIDILVVDNDGDTLQSWYVNSFPSDPLLAGIEADADNDGQNAIVEWMTNSDPMNAADVNRPFINIIPSGDVELSAQTIGISFYYDKLKTDYSVIVESSNDLSDNSWETLWDSAVDPDLESANLIIVPDTSEGWLTVSDSAQVDTMGKNFFRLKYKEIIE